MRYFFLLFLCFSFIFCPFIKPLRADESSLSHDLNKTGLGELFKNGMDDSSPISNKKGIGNWVKTPYGKIRLLSRESGTKDLDKVLMAVEVDIDSEKSIKEPVLKLIQSENVSDYRFFLPVDLPLRQELVYTKSTVFPLSLTLQKAGAPVQASVELSVQYCENNECISDSAVVSLDVSDEQNYFTPFSSFIHYSFKFIPQPATDKQIQAGLLSDDTFWLTLDLPSKIQEPKFLFLNAENSTPIACNLIQSNIGKKKAFFVFRTQENLQKKDIRIFLSDEKQTFSRTIKLEKAPMPQVLSTTESQNIPFYLWLVFLLFSPTLCLLLQQKPRNEIIARKDLSKSILWITAGILCGIPIYIFYPYSILSHSVVWLTFGTLLFAFLGIFSYPITKFGYGVLVAIVPFFAFIQNESIPVPTSFPELTSFFCLLAVLNALPFLAFMIRPYTLVQMGRAFEKQPQYKLRFIFFLDALLFTYTLLFALFR